MSRWFSVMLIGKLLFTPIKIRIFGPKRPNLVQNLHFWSFWAKYCHFLHILSNDRPKTMCTRCLGEFSVMWVTKLMISQVKKKDFLPQNDQIWPKIGIFGWYGPGHAGFFGALLMGRLAVVARGLYLARHLFTLFNTFDSRIVNVWFLVKQKGPLSSSQSWKCLHRLTFSHSFTLSNSTHSLPWSAHASPSQVQVHKASGKPERQYLVFAVYTVMQ